MKKRYEVNVGGISAQRKRFLRRCWSAEKARVKRGGRFCLKRARPGQTMRMRIQAPAYLDIMNPTRRTDTVAFLEAIRRCSRQARVEIVLDFSGVRQFYPTGAVLLVAEVHRSLDDGQRQYRVQATRPRSSREDQVLKQIGIYDLLQIPCPESADDETVRHWRQATGVLSEGEKGGSILESYQGQLPDGITKGLYAGIAEAMTNTVHHAYLGEEGEKLRFGIGKRWWMLSQEKDDLLTVVICDLGIGIPRSLPRSSTFSAESVSELWRSLGLDRTDANAIKVALQLGRTRTGVEGRGKGLAEIVDAVNLSERGSVFISSNRGVFTSQGGDVMATNSSRSIHGTLIHWQVPIAGGEAGVGE